MPGAATLVPDTPVSLAEAGKSAVPHIVVSEVKAMIDLTESMAKRSPDF